MLPNFLALGQVVLVEFICLRYASANTDAPCYMPNGALASGFFLAIPQPTFHHAAKWDGRAFRTACVL